MLPVTTKKKFSNFSFTKIRKMIARDRSLAKFTCFWVPKPPPRLSTFFEISIARRRGGFYLGGFILWTLQYLLALLYKILSSHKPFSLFFNFFNPLVSDGCNMLCHAKCKMPPPSHIPLVHSSIAKSKSSHK